METNREQRLNTNNGRAVSVTGPCQVLLVSKGHCNCCGKDVQLLTDEELGESVCRVCRSFDVRRK